MNQKMNSNPCDRMAVMMLSPGPDYRGDQKPLSGTFPTGVWSNFYAISSSNVPVSSLQMQGFYNNEVSS